MLPTPGQAPFLEIKQHTPFGLQCFVLHQRLAAKRSMLFYLEDTPKLMIAVFKALLISLSFNLS